MSALTDRLSRDRSLAFLPVDDADAALWHNQLVTYTPPDGSDPETFQAVVDRTDLANLGAGRRSEDYQTPAGNREKQFAVLYCDPAKAIASLGKFTLADGSVWAVERQFGKVGALTGWYLVHDVPLSTRGLRRV